MPVTISQWNIPRRGGVSGKTLSSHTRRSGLMVPMVVGCLLRIGMAPFIHLGKPEYWEYGEIARNLLHGYGYAFNWYYLGEGKILHFTTAFMPPGQAYIVYAGLKVFGDSLAGHIAVFVAEILLNLAFIYCIGRILSEMFGTKRIVRLGVWLAAIYPSFIVASGSFGVISAVLLLDSAFLLSLLRLTRHLRDNKPVSKDAIVAGIVGGLLTLFRSESFAVIGLTVVLVLWLHRDVVRSNWKRLSLGIAAFALVASPWVVRNYIEFHKVILGSTSGSFNFWRGHNPNATGSSWNENGVPVWTTDTMWNEMEPGLPIDSNVEFTNADYHLRKAKEWIAAHPDVEAIRTLRKFALFWGIDWYSKSARSWPYVATYLMTFMLLIFGVRRLYRERKRWSFATRDAVAIIGLWATLYTGLTMLFFSLPRLQILLIGIYFPVVVYGADGVLRMWRKHRRNVEYEQLRSPLRTLATKQKVFVN